jgi:hypothetical protein
VVLMLSGCVCLTPEQLRELRVERGAAQAASEARQDAHDARVESLAQEAEQRAQAASGALRAAAPLLPPGVGALALAGAAMLIGRRPRRRGVA